MTAAKKVRKVEVEISQELFDEKLEELVSEMSAESILAIPGVREIVAEAMNNEVLKGIREDLEEYGGR